MWFARVPQRTSVAERQSGDAMPEVSGWTEPERAAWVAKGFIEWRAPVPPVALPRAPEPQPEATPRTRGRR